MRELRACLKSIRSLLASFYLAPEWNSGLMVRSPSPGTKTAEQGFFQSPLVDFVPLAPNSIPGAGHAMNDYFSNAL
jgi:hypothetical protein